MENRKLRVRDYLPADPNDWHRLVPAKRTFNSRVEDLHLALWGSHSDQGEQYREYLEAIYKDEAIEGSERDDDVVAAQILRSYAKEEGVVVVAEAGTAIIRKSLRVVLSKYGYSRKQRRDKDQKDRQAAEA